ncbi:hypothetical protein H106_02681 [Trichophyton rubrum CBS 735.88]|nr:hypothetical protein H106_02681 [Trichophyton rubrum CBS 735.88]
MADAAGEPASTSPGLEQSCRPSFSSSGRGGGGTGNPAIFNQTPRIPGQTTRNAEDAGPDIVGGARCRVVLLYLSAASRVPARETKQLEARGYSSRSNSRSTEAAQKQTEASAAAAASALKYGQDGIEMNRERRRRYAHHG